MLQPLSNNLLLEPVVKENASGIIIPETANKERPAIVKVVAIGPKVMNVKIGDKVLIKGYMVDPIAIENKEYLVGQEEAVIGIINK